jgi:hypothetical protein
MKEMEIFNYKLLKEKNLIITDEKDIGCGNC